jgi:hypothetical protein
MSLRTAIDQLAALSLAGVTHFALDETPERLERDQLPALMILPLETEQRRLFGERGSAFETLTFSSGERHALLPITHLLLVAPVNAGTGRREQFPALVDWIDAYLDALAADVTLNGELLQAAQVQIETGIFILAQRRYYGCAFRHRWMLAIGG